MSTKMKGIFKGLRHISNMFENEKETEMMIGYPTDVKHVAHIGWDGPSVNSPSWMNEFESSSPRQYSSAPLCIGDDKKGSSSSSLVSEDSRKAVRNQSCQTSPTPDLPEIPKSSRRRHTLSGDACLEETSPTKAKSEKKSRSRRASKNSTNESADSNHGSSSRSLPDLPKKLKKKKSKDPNGSSISSSRSKPMNKEDSSSFNDESVGPTSTAEGGSAPLKSIKEND